MISSIGVEEAILEGVVEKRRVKLELGRAAEAKREVRRSICEVLTT